MSSVGVVVVTCEKYAQYLPRVLDSLEGQTRKHHRIVVRNGPPWAESHVTARRLMKQGVAWTDSTLGEAANVGVKALIDAVGYGDTYIVRLDGDDWIAPDLIETEARYLDEHPDVDCVWCDTLHARLHRQDDVQEVYMVEPNAETELVNSCGAMYRRSCWEAIGGYSDMNHGENVDFWKRFHAAGFRSERIAQPLYFYRQHDSNMHNEPRET